MSGYILIKFDLKGGSFTFVNKRKSQLLHNHRLRLNWQLPTLHNDRLKFDLGLGKKFLWLFCVKCTFFFGMCESDQKKSPKALWLCNRTFEHLVPFLSFIFFVSYNNIVFFTPFWQWRLLPVTYRPPDPTLSLSERWRMGKYRKRKIWYTYLMNNFFIWVNFTVIFPSVLFYLFTNIISFFLTVLGLLSVSLILLHLWPIRMSGPDFPLCLFIFNNWS